MSNAMPQGPMPKNTTTPDMMPRAVHARRTGLVKIKMNTVHQIKNHKRRGTRPMLDADRGESVTVADLSQYPEAKTVVRCLQCGKDFKTEKDLISNHPSAREMKETNETHLYGWWSDDQEEGRAIGLLSDES